MKPSKFLASFILCLFVTGLSSFFPAYAGGHGGGEGGGAGYVKIESFTVNLQGGTQYLQISMSVLGGTPEVGASIVARMPIVRHELILVLSNQEADVIRTSQGKLDLMEQIKEAVNKAIEKKGHDGVTEVLFENFVVQ